jgi:hypothetical protein
MSFTKPLEMSPITDIPLYRVVGPSFKIGVLFNIFFKKRILYLVRIKNIRQTGLISTGIVNNMVKPVFHQFLS